MKKCNNVKASTAGITLVALVVTIVVLVILATVSINAVLGENGLIKKAQQAKDMYDQSVTAEEDAMNQLLAEYEGLLNDTNGSGGDTPTDPTSNWDLNKVDKITSEDGVVVPVPKGYIASNIDGEKSVETGFVIKEGTNGSATVGINEFVWVPVPDSTIMFGTDSNGNSLGKLYSFNGGTTLLPLNWTEEGKIMSWTDVTSYREPDVVTGADGNEDDALSTYLQQAGLSSTATAADFKEQLQNEFEIMKNSVEKYGGFYIGRYETGNLSQATAVVKKNNTDIGNQNWYTQYKLSKTIAANNNVVSSMIWGCQWNATIRWMQTSSDTEVVNYVTNSAEKGNYDGSVIATGSNETYSVNNIYDMAGNVYDWTLETYNEVRRTMFGGCYSDLGAAGVRVPGVGYPEVSSESYGSRTSLYINI